MLEPNQIRPEPEPINPQDADDDIDEPMVMDQNDAAENAEQGDQEQFDDEDEYYEEEEEPFEDMEEEQGNGETIIISDDDEHEECINSPSHPVISEATYTPNHACENPIFSDQDVDDFIKNNDITKGTTTNSETSFYSINNSTPSTSSILLFLDTYQVKQNEMSTTSSSKRKNKECIEDTASSGSVGVKKLKK